MSKGRGHYIKRLERRAAHLDRRVEEGERDGRDLSWDKAELTALRYAVRHLEECRHG